MQYAERVAESAMSGVGQVADTTRRAQAVTEAAISEAKAVHGAVENQIASYSAHVDASAKHAIEMLSGQVQEMAVQSGAQMLRTVEGVTRQLESEIQATATNMAATAEIKMRTVVKGMRQDVQSQIDQHCEDSRCRDEEARRRMDDIAVGLERLTKQLNDFRPVSETVVGDVQKQVSSSMDARLNLQSERIDKSTLLLKKHRKLQRITQTYWRTC